MTLLESLVALVILGLVATGFLSVFQGASDSARDAETWVRAVAHAEAAMEQTKLGGVADRAVQDPLPSGFVREIDVRPWLGAEGVEQITVTVTLPGGGAFVLHRLSRLP